MPAVFIAGSGTDVGKTFVACGLIRALIGKGWTVDGLKPVVSGFDPADWVHSDPGLLLRALGRAPTSEALETLSPWRYAAPLAPDLAARLERRSVDFDAVAGLCKARIAAAGETMLVIEGVGGVMSPLSEDRTGLDLMTSLGLPAVLVCGGYLGAISHTLTAYSALCAQGLAILAIVVSGGAAGDPPLNETVASVGRFVGDTAVLALPRASDPKGVFQDLAALLSPGGR
jgi:dethiobiotin synthetase